MATFRLIVLLGCLVFRPGAFAQPVQMHVTLEEIARKARERAEKPFQPPKSDLPREVRELNYDSYREIHFRHDKALWAKEALPFRLEFFHPGYLYTTPVQIHEFTATHAQPIRFVDDFFDYGKNKFAKKIPADAGYAGFKLSFPLSGPESWEEVASFLGASYFRMLGQNQRYGASARGLAIDSGEPDVKEEFPTFTDWWIGKPEKGLNTLRLYAILDSPSCAGAYEFLFRPGATTVADVSVVLFMRTNAAKTLGLAPLTSMFWFGENSENKPNDYRAEVHDSDGLLIRSGEEEFIWCPLNPSAALRHQTYPMTACRGFGLLQRDRAFSHYEDMFNLYQKVPSVWVEPRGNWSDGEVHLVELPTKSEAEDNIVAFWNPKEKPTPMQPYRFAYTLYWSERHDEKFAPSKVLQTRIGAIPGAPEKRQVMIDFAWKENIAETPVAKTDCTESATVTDVQVFKNELSRSWRVIFNLAAKKGNSESARLSCTLTAANKPISETWSYLWNP